MEDIKEIEEDKIKSVTTNETLSRYISELANDVKLTEFNLKEKSLLCSSIWAKWLSYLFLERENLSKVANLKKKILAKKMKSTTANDSVLRLKSEDKMNETDETMKKLNVLSQQVQDNIDYIERALNILQNFGFNIKNTTDILKLQLTR